jgi:pantoate--beta-alanine ligase
MRLIRSPRDMQALAADLKRQGHRLGLVPTMGCLHAGHLSLVAEAQAHADLIVLSIFVNPTQFGPNEDFARYPRPFDDDVRLCQKAGVDILFAPEPADMYPAGHSVFVEESALSLGLCGASRPGHFRGVLTVVAKLFNLCLPDVAVFGQKDAQQARLIAAMVRDLDFPVRILIAPIVREPDGLAMSSRNRYLAPEERRQALALHRGLQAAQALYETGERRTDALLQAARRVLDQAPLARVDYLAAVDADTLQPVAVADKPTLLAMAVFIGTTRLIDNLVLGAPP